MAERTPSSVGEGGEGLARTTGLYGCSLCRLPLGSSEELQRHWGEVHAGAGE